jgi:hypothetical protein
MHVDVPCELTGQPLAVLNSLAIRSEYIYHIVKAMEKAGVENPDEILKEAIYNVGKTWSDRFGASESPSVFFQKLVGNDDMKGVLKWACVEDGEDAAEYHFYRCPLVHGWQRMGLEPEEIERLCKIGHQIDYGNVESQGFVLDMHPGLGRGEEKCILRVTRKA